MVPKTGRLVEMTYIKTDFPINTVKMGRVVPDNIF
jgi:hypothetical protein